MVAYTDGNRIHIVAYFFILDVPFAFTQRIRANVHSSSSFLVLFSQFDCVARHIPERRRSGGVLEILFAAKGDQSCYNHNFLARISRRVFSRDGGAGLSNQWKLFSN